ncbi:MAG TPA: glycosyltransferase family 2 protein [Candidatus Limosilactobacillus merdigallinarum]|uniref:Glycosyltransferase family 2 protein n=1 Tax=Candidatus Limosilactobacillus merdigallinarum TaxID=2838652 RepID=A0A9D1VJ26_9LACO|nr:glycosyltransferase family 2 protein [Candidatus Limosilactobacillus merdigallinarum]
MEKQVAILMSTYNGEQYLGEQIQSIVDQTYSNWHLYIRDDGSKDNTTNIIKSYAEKDDRITFFNEKKIQNVGVVKSFMELLDKTDADFYMFSDQDDLWLPDKIAETLQCMVKQPYQQMPICIHSDLKVVNERLQGTHRMNGDRVWHDFYHLMFRNCVTGCTMMINQSLKIEAENARTDLSKVYMHDWWLALIASAFGKVVYLDEATLLYRQHGDNVMGSYETRSVRNYLHRALHQSADLKRTKGAFMMINEFKHVYGDKLNGKKKKYVSEYAKVFSGGTLITNLCLAIKLPPVKDTLKGKIFTTYLMTVYARKLRE